MKKILAAVLMLAALPVASHAVSATVNLSNSNLAISTQPAQDLGNFATTNGIASKLSVQLTYSTPTFASQTFTGGQESTGSITVVSTQALVAASATDTLTMPTTAQILGTAATDYITIVATAGLTGTVASFTSVLSSYSFINTSSPTIAINGQIFTYGSNWISTDTIADCAVMLASAINMGNYPFNAQVVSSTGVNISYISSGTFANGYGVSSSSPAAITTGTFSGGTNAVTLTINNIAGSMTWRFGATVAVGSNTSQTASFLANAITGSDGNFGSDGFVASSAPNSNIVASTANSVGIYANAFTVTSSSPALVSVSSNNFNGGTNPALLGAWFSIGGIRYLNGAGWTDSSGTSTGTCASIAALLNSVSTNVTVVDGGYGNVSASCGGGGVATLTAGAPGLAGNNVVLATSTSLFTIGSSSFTGGQSNASFTIGSVTLSYPNNWTLGSSSTTTSVAGSIASAINTNFGTVLVATNIANLVTATATANGSTFNFTLTATTVALTTNGFAGGITPSYSSGTATINIPGHGFPTGLPVLYTQGVAIGGLTNQVTYYAVFVDSNDIQLAATSTGAAAGLGIVITSTDNTTAKHTSTLAPGPYIQGSNGAFWQVSNDNVNWATFALTSANVTVSSYTFTPVFPSSTSVQDFGLVDYRYIRLNYTPPTQGALNVKAVLSSKD